MDIINLQPPFVRATNPASRTWWLEEALLDRSADSEPLIGDVRADVCIVGGGFTGLWTALELRSRPNPPSVLLVEADVCGAGASGANAGFVISLWQKFEKLCAVLGKEEALWLGDEAATAAEDVCTFAAEHASATGYRKTPWLLAATSPSQVSGLEDIISALSATGRSPLEMLDANRARELSGAPQTISAVMEPTGATVQPAALAQALATAARAAGVMVYEHSPVTRVRQAGTMIAATTPTGTIRAGAVLLAINAWAAQVPEAGRRLVMLASDTIVTEPLSSTRAPLDALGRIAVCDSRRRLTYFRMTPDGRMLCGRGGVGVGYGRAAARSIWGRARDADLLGERLAQLLPQLGPISLARSWTAPVEFSSTSLPFCGSPAPGVHYVTGYSGSGVGPSRFMARVAASRILGTDDAYSRCALAQPPRATLPPEPIRWLGGQLVMAAVKNVESHEDDGTEPRALVRRLAKVDPTRYVA